jgi:hypothetical protein
MAEAEQSSAWWRHYQRSWLRSDVVAGLTVRAVLVPESLVYATIAGVSPVVGDGGAVRKRRAPPMPSSSLRLGTSWP